MTKGVRGHKHGRVPHALRREQLLDIAEELFVAEGYAGTSIEEITRIAGVSRPVVYGHFGSKEAIFIACVERIRAELDADLATQFEPDADPYAQLSQGVEAAFRLLERDPGRWRLLFASDLVLTGEYSSTLEDMRFETVLGIAQRMAPRMPGVDALQVEALAHAISGTALRLGLWWLRRRPEVTIEQLIVYYRDIAWSIVTPYLTADD